MSKIIITIPIDLKIGEIFREQRSRLNLKNIDIFLPFFSNPDFTFLVDNLSLVGSSSFLRTEGEQQTTISVSVDSSVTSKFLSDVSSLTEMTYLGSTNPRKQLTSWARLCVLMFIKKSRDSINVDYEGSDIPIENATNYLIGYNKVYGIF